MEFKRLALVGRCVERGGVLLHRGEMGRDSVIVAGGGLQEDVVGDVETERVENIVGLAGLAEGVVEPMGDLEEHGDGVCDW